MEIKKEIFINTGIEKAWKILGHQFSNPSQWASSVIHSEGSGSSFQGASCSERGCSTSLGRITEKLYSYSDENHLLAYEIKEGMPSFVKRATNTWKLTRINQHKTLLQIHAVLHISGIVGTLLQPIMRIKMTSFASEALDDFKYYVEKGVPHPRKIKALEKTKKR